MRTDPTARFVADCSLGKLTKWLRLAGLDTRYDSMAPDFRRLQRIAASEGRTVLTRSQRVKRRLAEHQRLFIQYNAPLDQVRQVCEHFNLQRNDLMPLSRCAVCNWPLRPIQKELLPGNVPDYVRHRYERFLTCTRCSRIYWSGTHSARIAAQIDRWFA